MTMSVWLRAFVQQGLVLVAGTLVGWLYGYPVWGLLIAAFVLLAWHVYHLYILERWLRTGEHGPLPSGNGPWSQVLARIQAVNQQARASRQAWVRLVKEIRASTKAFPDGGVILDRDMEIVRCNKAARRMLGLRKKRDRGQRIANLIRHPDFVHYLESGNKKKSVEIPSPLEQDRWLSCRVIPYGADQKLLLVRDISESVTIARTRRDFAANASHELRTPLTVIAGYLDVMADDDNLPEAWRAPIQDMRDQSERMRRLVQDLLQLAKLESSESSPLDKVVDIGAILAGAQRDALALASRPREINLDIQSSDRILGEETEIQSVVTNLVTNALRYTPVEGSITIGWLTDDEGGQLYVEDSGIGIAPEEIPRVTERFYRTDGGRALQKAGTGLGLAIVKHALKRHDAELEIDSEVGKGSRFTCRFPAGRLAPADEYRPLSGVAQ